MAPEYQKDAHRVLDEIMPMFYGDINTVNIEISSEVLEVAYRRSYDEVQSGGPNPFKGKIEVLGYVEDVKEDTITTEPIPESDREHIENKIDKLTGEGWIGFE